MDHENHGIGVLGCNDLPNVFNGYLADINGSMYPPLHDVEILNRVLMEDHHHDEGAHDDDDDGLFNVVHVGCSASNFTFVFTNTKGMHEITRSFDDFAMEDCPTNSTMPMPMPMSMDDMVDDSDEANCYVARCVAGKIKLLHFPKCCADVGVDEEAHHQCDIADTFKLTDAPSSADLGHPFNLLLIGLCWFFLRRA